MLRGLFLASALTCACGRGGFDQLGEGTRTDGDTPEPQDAAGDPSAVKLITKHVFGGPNASFTIAFSGGDAADLTLLFRDAAQRVVHSSVVSTAGTVTLPAAAGVYSVELRDRRTGGMSYGQATVTLPIASFSSQQTMTLGMVGSYAPRWPNLSMVAVDINGDGYRDFVRISGVAGVAGLSVAGIYTQLWNPTTNRLEAEVAAGPLPGHRICGFAAFDDDGDGDSDVVTVSIVEATLELDVCRLRNDGTGGFGSPVCATEPGTMQDSFTCDGGVAAGDFDRDGRIDLAVAGGRIGSGMYTTTELRLLRNTGDGFTAATTWSAPATVDLGYVAVGDVNDDGRLDVFTNGGSPPRLRVFAATDDFVLAPPIELTSAHGNYEYDPIVPAYLDGDATLDVLLVHADGPSSVFFSDGQTLTPTVIPSFTEQHGSRFRVLDLDIDGTVDVVIPYKNRYLQTNRPGAMRKTVPELTQTLTPSAANSIVGALPESSWCLSNYLFDDWDLDGRIDSLNVIAYTMELELLHGN